MDNHLQKYLVVKQNAVSVTLKQKWLQRKICKLFQTDIFK